MATQGVHFTEDEARQLVEAIRSAEQGNRGEVRVHMSGRLRGDPLEQARRAYEALGMHQTRDDTGVLLLVAPADRVAAVFAGEGVHGAAEPGFWDRVVEAVAEGYARGAGLDGLKAALGLIGDLLRRHIPGADAAGNELPDAVTQGDAGLPASPDASPRPDATDDTP